MFTINIVNKDTNDVVFSNKDVKDYTFNKGLINELTMITEYSRIYTTIRDNEILIIAMG